MAIYNKEVDIYTFLKFENQVAQEVFCENPKLAKYLRFHVFDKRKFVENNSTKIFLGISAGNPACTKKGEVYACRSLNVENISKVIEVSPKIDLGVEKVGFLYTPKPIRPNFKWPNDVSVADMESQLVIEANGICSNIFRIVCDYGVESENFSLKEYKKNIFEYYSKGLRILMDKILYLINN